MSTETQTAVGKFGATTAEGRREGEEPARELLDGIWRRSISTV